MVSINQGVFKDLLHGGRVDAPFEDGSLCDLDVYDLNVLTPLCVGGREII